MGVSKDLAGSERAKVLWRIGELIDQNAAGLADLESLNAGMVPAQAQATVSVSSEFFRYYAGWCTKPPPLGNSERPTGLHHVHSTA